MQRYHTDCKGECDVLYTAAATPNPTPWGCAGKNLSEKQCGQLGCCQFVLGFMCKSALTKNKMCTSARGLYFESYAGHGNSLTKLGNPTGATWNKMKPKREHPGLNHDLWYSNDKDFVRDIPKFTDMDNYMMRFRGELQVIKPGEYTFQTNSGKMHPVCVWYYV